MKKFLIALLFVNLLVVNTSSVYAQETTTTAEGVASTSSDWSEYENDLASQKAGYVFKQLFSNDTPIVLENDQTVYTINRYAYYDIAIGESHSRSIIIDMTYKNKTDKVLYINPIYGGTYIRQSNERYVDTTTFNLMSEESSIIKKLQQSEYLLPPQSEVSGAVVINISYFDTDKLDLEPIFYLDGPKVFDKREDGSNFYIAPEELITLPLSQERIEKLQNQPEPHLDIATEKKWGTKSVIEQGEINQTITANDIDVTLHGYQFADFLPNSLLRESFKDWDLGVVFMTMDVTVKNNTTQVIDLNNTIANLDTGIFNPVRIPNYEQLPEKTLLQPGDEGRWYLVFENTKGFFDTQFGDPEDQSYLRLSIELFNDANERINKEKSILFKVKE